MVMSSCAEQEHTLFYGGHSHDRPCSHWDRAPGQSRRNPMEQRWRQRQRTLLAVAGLGWLAYKVVQWGGQANLDGQVVLVTGGSRGLGLALAREFARAGCRVVLAARDAQELARAEQDLRQRGAAVLAVPCDVTNQEQVCSEENQATHLLGGVVLV